MNIRTKIVSKGIEQSFHGNDFYFVVFKKVDKLEFRGAKAMDKGINSFVSAYQEQIGRASCRERV